MVVRELLRRGGNRKQNRIGQGDGGGQDLPHFERCSGQIAAFPGFSRDVGTEQVGRQTRDHGTQAFEVISQRLGVQWTQSSQDGQAGWLSGV